MAPHDADPAAMLLRKSHDDLDALTRMVAAGGFPAEIVGFHAQQCCEKAFKAVLARTRVHYPFTHDLLALVDLLRDAGIEVPLAAEDAPTLTPFAVVYRYEDLDIDDAPAADWIASVATAIHLWAAGEINPSPEP